MRHATPVPTAVSLTEIQNRSSKQEAHNPMKVFEEVFSVIEDRKEHPKEGSYTNYLFDKGIDKILKKVGEEATEIVIAAKNPNPNEIKYEIADFLYHMMVLMAEKGVTWEEITEEWPTAEQPPDGHARSLLQLSKRTAHAGIRGFAGYGRTGIAA